MVAGAHHVEAITVVRKLLADNDASVVQHAEKVLRHFAVDDKQSIVNTAFETDCALLFDTEWSVRQSALRWLRTLPKKDYKAVVKIVCSRLGRLREEDASVKHTALEALLILADACHNEGSTAVHKLLSDSDEADKQHAERVWASMERNSKKKGR